MSIFSLGFFGLFVVGLAAAGPKAMVDAFERGDLDEASRQGVLAGPVAVEQSLEAPTRTARLAGIVAAPRVEDRAELLTPLALTAGSGDRRIAIPAAHAARTIARELAQRELPDDLDTEDVASWRSLYLELARNGQRFIEVRVLALDTVAALSLVTQPDALAFDLGAALGDPDPAYRAAAIALVPRPTPADARAPLANTVKNDADAHVALAAARVLCGDDRAPALPLLGAQGLDRIKDLVAGKPGRTVRDARRCLER